MKIRNGYVSNSSSSSFMIVYKNINDFIKLKMFDGYNTLINDIKNNNLNDFVTYISSMLYMGLYTVYEAYTKDELEPPIQWEIYDLFDMCKLSNESTNKLEQSYCKKMHEINKLGFEFKNKTANYSIKEKYDAIHDYMQNFYSNDRKIKNECKKIAEKIVKRLKMKNYKIAILRYEDHDSLGSYMEHQFMPFVKINPDRKYEIWSSSNH